MATLAVLVNLPDVTTGAINSGVWRDISNVVGAAEIIRRIAVAEAAFDIPGATVQDRKDLRQHSEVQITITEGANVIRFAGFVEKAKPITNGPGSFNLEVACVGYEFGAVDKIIWNETYPDKLNTLQTLTLQPDGASGKDAYIRAAAINENNGNAASLGVSPEDQLAGDRRMRSLLEFDLSSIPAKSRIEEATLELTIDGWDSQQHIFVEAHAIEAAWAESTVTWNNQPSFRSRTESADLVSYGGTALGTPGGPPWVKHKWDLRDLVQEWVSGSLANNGVMLVAQNEATQFNSPAKWFISSDHPTQGLERPKLTVKYMPPVKYTDALIDLWNTYWPSVDTSKVVGDPATFGQKTQLQYANLAEATERIKDKLPGYHWWIEWAGGTTYYLRFEPKGNTPSGKTITELDVGHTYEMEPSNTNVVNTVVIIGGTGGGPDPGPSLEGKDPLAPIVGSAVNTNSATIFGSRRLFIEDPNIETRELGDDRAAAEMAGLDWEYFEGTFAVQDFALEPGHLVTLSLPAIGANGVDFSDQYVVTRTVDAYRRGAVRREVTFREVSTL